tara:strand:- start:98 stop:328 length:231 start_codon:yes stop_codon:yes gene_type:complete
MEQNHTALSELFAQLGLPNQQQEIQQFIKLNSGLATETKIEDAQCWTSSQADFLKTALAEDGEWAEVIDQLSTRLR